MTKTARAWPDRLLASYVLASRRSYSVVASSAGAGSPSAGGSGIVGGLGGGVISGACREER